jgi:hypothetical protein
MTTMRRVEARRQEQLKASDEWRQAALQKMAEAIIEQGLAVAVEDRLLISLSHGAHVAHLDDAQRPAAAVPFGSHSLIPADPKPALPTPYAA